MDQGFFKVIREVQDKTPLNPIYMSVKDWYKLLLERNVTTREVDQEGRRELVPCKIEERNPTIAWSDSYRVSRLKGLSPDSKSFLFKLVHTLLRKVKKEFTTWPQQPLHCAGASLVTKRHILTCFFFAPRIGRLGKHYWDVSNPMISTWPWRGHWDWSLRLMRPFYCRLSPFWPLDLNLSGKTGNWRRPPHCSLWEQSWNRLSLSGGDPGYNMYGRQGTL